MWRTYRLVGLLGLSSTPATDGSLGYGNSTYIALGSPGGYGGDIVSLYPAGETPARAMNTGRLDINTGIAYTP